MLPETNGSEFSKHTADFNRKKIDLGKDFQDLGKITGSLAHDAVQVVKDNASEYYEEGTKQVKNIKKGIETHIQEKPLQSLLIVAGIGLVLGVLWNRR